MAYVYVEIEDYLCDVSTQSLIDELENRDDKPTTYSDDLETALHYARNGHKEEALLWIERAFPEFKGLLWKVDKYVRP